MKTYIGYIEICLGSEIFQLAIRSGNEVYFCIDHKSTKINWKKKLDKMNRTNTISLNPRIIWDQLSELPKTMILEEVKMNSR